jgi:hypothetical protein
MKKRKVARARWYTTHTYQPERVRALLLHNRVRRVRTRARIIGIRVLKNGIR